MYSHPENDILLKRITFKEVYNAVIETSLTLKNQGYEQNVIDRVLEGVIYRCGWLYGEFLSELDVHEFETSHLNEKEKSKLN